MIYVCIPARNEAATLGAVLWKTRRALADAGREFRIVVLDDASTDATAEVLERYRGFVPLELLSSGRCLGFAEASARLLRWAAADSDYPKRDFAVLLQADLTEDPADVLPLVKALQGGADLAASNPDAGSPASGWLRRLLGRIGGRRLAELPGDPFSSLRGYRVSVLRQAFASLEGSGGGRGFGAEGWAASACALSLFSRFSRRSVETATSFRPHLRARRSRSRPLFEAVRLLLGRRALRRALGAGLAAAALLAPIGLAAQDPGADPAADEAGALDSLAALYPVDENAAAVSFGPGERLTYQVKLGIFGVGTGELFVEGIDEVRGHPTYRAGLRIDGGFLGFKYKQEHTTFIDTETLQSHRYLRTTDQTGYQGERHYEMYPAEGEWRREDVEDSGPLGSSLPLDDLSFIFYLRQMELEVGKTYTVPRYFKEDGNPVVIRVLRREAREVEAGVFECLVIEPVVQVEGMFAEGMNAEIYLTDDERRLLVYLNTDVPRLPGSLHLYLTDHRAGLPLNPEARSRLLEAGRPAEDASN